MELRLTSFHRDVHPGAAGFFIEGGSLEAWIAVLDRLGLPMAAVELHGLPTRKANEIWGCLVLTSSANHPAELGPLASAHTIGNQLIVPGKCRVIPELTPYDLERLFGADTYVLHPDVGLFKLTKALKLAELLDPGALPELETARPADHYVALGEIRSFSVAPTPPEALQLELNAKTDPDKFPDRPLSLGEKLRLRLYKSILINDGEDGKGVRLSQEGSTLQGVASLLGIGGSDLHDKLVKDFEHLQERNKKEIDKLLDLMKKDPEAALRYAIPLDEQGTSRGEFGGEFRMQDRGIDFSLFGRSGGGGTVDLGDDLQRLRLQYISTAQELREKGQHEKAAFIYLKLLKDYYSAASTLQEGKHYEKAAHLYLEYLKNELNAARCYEEGKIYAKAISLYAGLGHQEKVGDLHLLRGDRTSANAAYQLQINVDLEKNQYVKAANLSRDKMLNLPYAQEILLKGWDAGRDEYGCLRNYLKNIRNAEEVWQTIEWFQKEKVTTSNDTVFLKVLREEYANQDENAGKIREMALTLISGLLKQNRTSAHELLVFNQGDKRLRADTLRYDLTKNRRGN